MNSCLRLTLIIISCSFLLSCASEQQNQPVSTQETQSNASEQVVDVKAPEASSGHNNIGQQNQGASGTAKMISPLTQ